MVLQPAIFGTQTQQPVETSAGPEHLEHLPKHRVVQNGDPRDNKNLPAVREWVTSIDFKDAYFHISVLNKSFLLGPGMQWFLRAGTRVPAPMGDNS